MTNNQSSTEAEENYSQKLNDVFQILADVIAPEPRPDQPRPKIAFRQALRMILKFWVKLVTAVLKEADFWEKRFFIGTVVLVFLSCAFVVKINIIRAYRAVPDKWLIRAALICILFIYLFLLSFIALNSRRTWKSPSLYTRSRLRKSIDEAIENQSIIKFLCEKSNEKILNSARSQINLLVESIQVEDKTNSNFLPLLALGSVVLGIYVLGVPTQTLEDGKFLYGAVTGIPGIVALTLLILKLTIDLSLQSQILKYKKCLSLLERAQDLIHDRENET